MITDQLEKKHWINMAIRFVTDMGLVCLSFLMALIIPVKPRVDPHILQDVWDE